MEEFVYVVNEDFRDNVGAFTKIRWLGEFYAGAVAAKRAQARRSENALLGRSSQMRRNLRKSATTDVVLSIAEATTGGSRLSRKCEPFSAKEKIAEKVAEGELDSAFAIVKPLGHHAKEDEPRGFCLFNNVGIATSYLLNERVDLGIKKILIVDWDVHHGNVAPTKYFFGRIIVNPTRHEAKSFYPCGEDGSHLMIGEGPGAGYNINVPWENAGRDDADYIAVWDNILVPIAKEFYPDLIMISAGFDADSQAFLCLLSLKYQTSQSLFILVHQNKKWPKHLKSFHRKRKLPRLSRSANNQQRSHSLKNSFLHRASLTLTSKMKRPPWFWADASQYRAVDWMSGLGKDVPMRPPASDEENLPQPSVLKQKKERKTREASSSTKLDEQKPKKRQTHRGNEKEKEDDSGLIARTRASTGARKASKLVKINADRSRPNEVKEETSAQVPEPKGNEGVFPQCKEAIEEVMDAGAEKELKSPQDGGTVETCHKEVAHGEEDLFRGFFAGIENVTGSSDLKVPRKSLGEASSSSKLTDQFPTPSVDPGRKRTMVITVPEYARVLGAPVWVSSYL
uniref:Histone deacetylase 18-like n=1 Tax=Nicotiana tabacum TaxID=4097 RepID=A0A1S3XT60_TOBAC|nr:PREDICTED: histone deacetylase 18-like [Nicotiana tabacum]